MYTLVEGKCTLKITRMDVCVCVCVVEENGFFVSQKQKWNKYRKKEKNRTSLFLVLEEGEPYFKSMVFLYMSFF